MAEDAQDATAADDGDASGETGAKKKKLPGKVLVLFIGLPLLLIIVGALAFFFLLGGEEEDHASKDDHVAEHGDKDAKDDHGSKAHGDDHGKGHGKDKGDHHGPGEIPPLNPEDAIFFDLPDILVNLNASGKKQVYLKLRVALELHKEADTTALDASMPRVIDRFQTYLREMRVEDLSGSAGLFRVKEELLRRINVAAQPVHIYDVLFREMLIQ